MATDSKNKGQQQCKVPVSWLRRDGAVLCAPRRITATDAQKFSAWLSPRPGPRCLLELPSAARVLSRLPSHLSPPTPTLQDRPATPPPHGACSVGPVLD